MGRSAELHNENETPRYIFDRTNKGLMGELKHMGTIEPFTSTLECIPSDLQEYVCRRPPSLARSRGRWTTPCLRAAGRHPFHTRFTRAHSP